MIEFRYMRFFLVIFLWLSPSANVIADSIYDYHDVRGRESKSSNLILDQVVVRDNKIEHKDANHDGFYSITFDPVQGATGIEFEWNNEGHYKHWTVREIEAYTDFGSRIIIVSGKVIPGAERTSDKPFTNAFDGDVETSTFTTSSGTTAFPQRTFLQLVPGNHSLDRIRINDVAGNGENGRMKQIAVRVTTDTDDDLKDRKYIDVSNLSVQIFGENIIEGELLPMKGQSRTQGMKNYGSQWSGDAHMLWDGGVNESMETSIVIDKQSKYNLQFQLTKAPDYGEFDIYLDEKLIASKIDLYAKDVVLADLINVSELQLDKGQHTIRFKLLGSNKKASTYRKNRYLLGLDYIKIVNMLQNEEVSDNNLADIPSKEKDETKSISNEISSINDVVNITLKDIKPILVSRCYGCHGAVSYTHLTLPTIYSV